MSYLLFQGKFGPAFLACPKTYSWHPIEECRKKLDENRYSEFNPKGEISLFIFFVFYLEFIYFTLFGERN